MLKTLIRLLTKFDHALATNHLFHTYITIKDTGFRKYNICKICGKRDISGLNKRVGQPVDMGWLYTGEWTKMKPPPPTTRESFIIEAKR